MPSKPVVFLVVLLAAVAGLTALYGRSDGARGRDHVVPGQDANAADAVSDQFERRSLGPDWAVNFGHVGLVDDSDLGLLARSGMGLVTWVGPAPGADQYSEAVLSSNKHPRMLTQVFVRRQQGKAAPRYGFHYDGDPGDGEWQIKYDGVPTKHTRILARNATAPPPRPGDVLRIEARGTHPVEIKGFRNGELILEATDATATRLTHGRPGLAYRLAHGSSATYPSPVFESWRAGTLSSGQSSAVSHEPAMMIADRSQAVAMIDGRTMFQTMEGFGTSQRLFSDPHLIGGRADDPDPRNGLRMTPADEDAILQEIYGELGLTRVRLAIYPVRVEPVNDNDDPDVADLSKFDFGYKQGDGFLDYVERARRYGLRVWWYSPVNLESWMSEGNPEEYVEWAMVFLRRWRARGLELPYFSIMNEPGYRRGGFWSGEYLRDVIVLLGRKLRAEGFATRIVVPDDLNPTQARLRLQVILADPEARQYVGALAYHLYGGAPADKTCIREMGERYRIPIWMSEYSTRGPLQWASLMHELIVQDNVSAIDYMFAFVGNAPASLISLAHRGTEYLGYTRTKHYYVMGQFSRFVRPGFRRIEATSTDDHVEVSAYRRGDSLVIVAINEGRRARDTRFCLEGLAGISRLQGVRTTASENWAPLSAVSSDGACFAQELPGRSITTLTNELTAAAASTSSGSGMVAPRHQR